MSKDASKCPRCDGWAFEPDVTPIKACATCHGTGRPAERQAALVGDDR